MAGKKSDRTARKKNPRRPVEGAWSPGYPSMRGGRAKSSARAPREKTTQRETGALVPTTGALAVAAKAADGVGVAF